MDVKEFLAFYGTKTFDREIPESIYLLISRYFRIIMSAELCS